jgi:hydrogenase expression/formation protein HypE
MSNTDQSAGEPDDGAVVTLAHGAGAGSMRSLVDEVAVSRFTADDPGVDGDQLDGAIGLSALDDGAAHPLPDGERSVVVTTDSHVVTPPVFPGGDIGRLAVAGTINDLAVMGAVEPLALTCSLVVEEGFPVRKLESLMESVQHTCEEAGVQITTGDTKVMGSGEVDGPVINTTGIGLVSREHVVADAGLSPGDEVIVTGTVGDHGITLLSEREGFGFEGDLESDVAPVNGLLETALAAGSVTAMKDPTRGGLSTALNEMASKGNVGLELDETAIPVDDTVAAAGEVLGIDPFDIANEGKAVLGVESEDADAVLSALQSHPQGREAALIGRVTDEHRGRVVLDTGFGRRYLSEPDGQTLPRIC